MGQEKAPFLGPSVITCYRFPSACEGLGIIFFNFVSNYCTSHYVYALCRDIKKARLLLKSVITTNPQHGPGK